MVVAVAAVLVLLLLVVVDSVGYVPELKNFTSVHSVAKRLLHLHNIYIAISYSETSTTFLNISHSTFSLL